MKVIIAGSRDIVDYNEILAAVHWSGWQITEVVSGAARGVDRLGEQYAYQNGIKVISCPADWHKYGKSAGYIRNQEMANYADALIAIWDGSSRGTAHMIQCMNNMRKLVHVRIVTVTTIP